MTSRVLQISLVLLVLSVALAACGSSGSDSSSETTTTEVASTNEEAAGGETSSAAAEEVVAPYIGKPSAFPVTEMLKEVPKGAKVAFMDCGTPTCALFWEVIGAAAKTMGVQLERIKAGTTASTASAAFDTAVTSQPDAVITTSIDVELWSHQLKELQEAGIPVVSIGLTEVEKYGIESPQGGSQLVELGGKLFANYVTANMGKNVVIYEIPELSFSRLMTQKFSSELEAICSECSVRTAQIQASTLGNTAPSTVVSDLQANPETEVAVFTADEIQVGLPTALKSAGIEIETLGWGPTPTNLQYLKEGKETAVLAFDLPVLSWTVVDQAAREIVGQKLTGLEAEGLTDLQFLTPTDITFDPTKGWTGYPNFAEMFAKLWGVEG